MHTGGGNAHSRHMEGVPEGSRLVNRSIGIDIVVNMGEEEDIFVNKSSEDAAGDGASPVDVVVVPGVRDNRRTKRSRRVNRAAS